MDDMNKDDMSKKEDFNFEWLPGFREMMVCQNDSQTQSLLPPEQLQQEEQITQSFLLKIPQLGLWQIFMTF